jgi:restriction system protein
MRGILVIMIMFIIITIIIIITLYAMLPKEREPNNNTKKKKYIKKTEKVMHHYKIPEKIKYNPWNTVHPANENGIRWTKSFLKSMEWKRYEEVCMEYLRLKNCNANVTSIGADGGIDIKIHDRNGSLFAIGQCKAWNKKPIGVNLIREIYGVMASEQIKHGIFLTTSIYSQEAIEFAKNKALLLIDGDEFVKLINGLDEINKQRIDQIATEGDYTTPTCVHCNVKMVRRTASKGKNEGNDFWGCVNFPRCRKILF